MIAFVGIFLETSLFVGLAVPGDAIVLVTASANEGVAEWALSVVAVVSGSLGGESVGFAIGRFLGPRLRTSVVGRRLGERSILRAERWLDRRGGFAIALSRFLPVLHALMPVTAGAAGFPYQRFIAWTAPACAVWAVLYATVGTLAGSGYRRFVEQYHFVGWVVLGALALFLVSVVLGKRLLHRLEQR